MQVTIREEIQSKYYCVNTALMHFGIEMLREKLCRSRIKNRAKITTMEKTHTV